MKYSDVRGKARTGDVLLVQSTGVIGRLIRALTGESFSHVAMLLWIEDSLFVSEFVEFRGYQLLPASLWVGDRLQQGDKVSYGIAPETVRLNSESIQSKALVFRKGRYGYLSLIKIWLSQLFRVKIKTRRFVCSSYVGRMWSYAGFDTARTPDPGDFLEYCQSTSPITEE